MLRWMKQWISLWMKHGTELGMKVMHSYPQIARSMPIHETLSLSTGKSFVTC